MGLPLHALHACGALGQLQDVDILLILQVFRAPFVEAKDLFTRNVCTSTLYCYHSSCFWLPVTPSKVLTTEEKLCFLPDYIFYRILTKFSVISLTSMNSP